LTFQILQPLNSLFLDFLISSIEKKNKEDSYFWGGIISFTLLLFSLAKSNGLEV
jgi:hypothetical protein